MVDIHTSVVAVGDNVRGQTSDRLYLVRVLEVSEPSPPAQQNI
jgi:hypothetical protein